MLSAGRAVYRDFKNLCIWKKNNGGMGSLYRSKHELVFVFKHGTGGHVNNFGLGEQGRQRFLPLEGAQFLNDRVEFLLGFADPAEQAQRELSADHRGDLDRAFGLFFEPVDLPLEQIQQVENDREWIVDLVGEADRHLAECRELVLPKDFPQILRIADRPVRFTGFAVGNGR